VNEVNVDGDVGVMMRVIIIMVMVRVMMFACELRHVIKKN
jgi:hypothetical protein